MYLFDGGMGTMLQKGGMPEGYCPELMVLEHPDVVEKIHEAYILAGADIVTTNTFGGTALKLADYGLSHKVREINTQAAQLARNCFRRLNKKGYIAGSMGPTGAFIRPLGNLSFDEAYEAYREQGEALIAGGVDFLIIETVIDVQEMRAALLGAADARKNMGKTKAEVKIICHMAYSEDGRTVTGTSPEEAAVLAEAMGADIIGANCSLGPEQLLPVIKKLAENTNLPISVEPNAGMPVLVEGETVFPLGPEAMAGYVKALVEAGATYIGGCCGTNPQHIKAMGAVLKTLQPAVRKPKPRGTVLTSRSRTVRFGQGMEPVIIGERINPTGRKKLAAEIAGGSLLGVKQDALEQVEKGAKILDVNMGVPNIDEAAVMAQAVTELSMLVETPLAVDSLNPKAIEAALKVYPGRALINSVNAEAEQMEAIIPLAKRYGAALLCLPIAKGYLPETAEERCKLAEIIVTEAKKAGLRDEDLLLDPLVLTLAAGNEAARETIRTLKMYREKFGYATVMGLSNISFGLPERPFMNSQFLMMALTAGLTTPIMNPLNNTVMRSFVAGCTLLGFDQGAQNYIRYCQENPYNAEQAVKKVTRVAEEEQADTPLAKIRWSVKKGEKELVEQLVARELKEGTDPLKITDEGLSLAMKEIGQRFGAGEVFLPQVMLAAEAMQAAFQVIKKELPDNKQIKKGKVVLATVKGDIHDLGKNIVAALLENNGYEIIDLGKDVPPEEVVEAIRGEKPSIVGLASLMTTTLPQVNRTVEAIRSAGLNVPIIVGGAVVTPEYAREAGADLYAKDGIIAVELVNDLLGK